MADVTVYIPTRNRAQLVARAVASVIAQTHSDWRCIVVDDASDDDTPRVLEGLAAADPRITYLRQDQPMGACAARNRAIEAATTDYVTGLDDDDMFMPPRLALLLAAARSSSAQLFTTRDLLWRRGRMKEQPKPLLIDLPMLLRRNLVGNQVLTRRENVLAVGGFDVQLPSWQDYDLWVRLVQKFGPVNVLPDFTQIIFIADSSARITTDTSKQQRGMEIFFAKHGAAMDWRARAAHRARHQSLRGEPAAILNSIGGLDASSYAFYELYWSVARARLSPAKR